MIKVFPQPEPANFDKDVRQKGQNFMVQKGIDPLRPLPPKTAMKAFWQGKCLEQLHAAYGGICAYFCVYIEIEIGGPTVDHFQPKSVCPDLAYEWSNYRLACTKANTNKREFLDVLDPFAIENDWFVMDFGTGQIRPDSTLAQSQQAQILATLNRLKLNSASNCKLRLKHFNEFIKHKQNPSTGVSVGFLQEKSPFVWYQAKKQNLI
jgi:uncharacterized protein (TIGR02646 family)